MKRAAALLLVCVFLAGCSSGENALDAGMELRAKVLHADEITFRVDISADHGDTLDLFSMECRTNRECAVSFAVISPGTISGITGQIAGGAGSLTFDDVVLCFPLVARNRISPVSAPWILIKTLCSGYLRTAGVEDDQLRLTFDDSYEEDALQVDIWLDENRLPKRAEILCEGQLALSMCVKDFEIL